MSFSIVDSRSGFFLRNLKRDKILDYFPDQTELWYEWRAELHWLQRNDDVPPNVIAMATELDAQLTKLTGQHWTQSLHQLIARPGWALVEEQIDRLLRADEA